MMSYNKDVHDLILKSFDFSNAKRVLDIGYGKRYLLNQIHYKYLNIECCGIEKNEAPLNQMYDFVFMCDVIEHLSQKERDDYFQFVKENLSKDGKFIISTPNTNNLYEANCFWDEPTHTRPYNKMAIIELANQFNLELSHEIQFHFFKNPKKLFLNWLLGLDNYNKHIFVLKKSD